MNTDDMKHFQRTKLPRMHQISQGNTLLGLIYVPMKAEDVHLLMQAYAMVSPVFKTDLKKIIDDQPNAILSLLLHSLAMLHPEQRMAQGKRWDLGYNLTVHADEGRLIDGTLVHGITIEYPIKSDAKDVLALVRSLLILNHDAPPVQFYSIPPGSIIAPRLFSVSRNSVSILDAESDMFADERMNHESEQHCYLVKVLFQQPSGLSIPHFILHKAKIFIPVSTAAKEAIDIHYEVPWVDEKNGYVFQDGTVLRIVSTKRIPSIEYEILKKSLG